MSRQVWTEVWADDKGFAATLINTYTTAKSALNPSSGLGLIPANYLEIGSKFKFTFGGAVSNRVTGPDSMTFQIMVGAVIACSSGALNLVTTANTLAGFKGECFMQCTAIGNATNAKLEGIWDLKGASFGIAASLANSGIAVGPSSPAGGTGFDSTISNSVDLWVGQSVSNAGNGIRVDYWTFESLD